MRLYSEIFIDFFILVTILYCTSEKEPKLDAVKFCGYYRAH